MEREIKFRAWDESTQTMHTCEGMNNNHSDKWNSAHFLKYFDCCDQYTGLKDSKGVELYRGDILTNGKNITGVVVWDNGTSSFRLKAKVKDTERFYEITEYGMRLFTIIGNVHQHSHLINK